MALDQTVADDIGASALPLAEVLGAPARAGRMGAVKEALGVLNIDELPFLPDTATRLAHLLAADTEHLGAGVASFDHRLCGRQGP